MTMDDRRLPTAEEVLGKIKDDGDFDMLRLKVIRKVKENEELRNSIISQVKDSNVLNEESSEELKPRQLSDAIYEELGRKIMGQISDEIWKVIRSNDGIRDDIRGTVESVFNKMMKPELGGDEDTNPSETNDVIDTVTASTKDEANMSNSNEKLEPSSSFSLQVEARPGSSPVEGNEFPVNSPDRNEALPPGFGSNHGCIDPEEDPDLPPGFD
ncbi:hypothetical protein HPP92_005751 [Vanilla planifolia]|uniref:Uncharacterized protein n=1 Tax=Vanilla planifolia TaxID=51239 RepID=A0A835RZB3_VANPL|nr:hypothetical protein HPP92_005751 [Vanilla planifolia]